MNEAPEISCPQREASRPATSLGVVLAYRDTDHERLGKSYWEALSRRLTANGGFMVSEWKFGMLVSPALRTVAAAEAAEARLVVLATASDEALPEGVKIWMDCWCSYRPATLGVLTVILSEAAGSSAKLWPDYSLVYNKMARCGRRLVAYASGRTPEMGSAFCLAEARLVLPRGLVALEDFPEVAALTRPAPQPSRC